jgi:hypothetical protein
MSKTGTQAIDNVALAKPNEQSMAPKKAARVERPRGLRGAPSGAPKGAIKGYLRRRSAPADVKRFCSVIGGTVGNAEKR